MDFIGFGFIGTGTEPDIEAEVDLTLINAAFFYYYLTRGGGAIICALKSTQKSGFRGKAW